MAENLLLSNIPKEEFKRLRPYLEPVKLDFKQTLLEVDMPIQYVYFPDDAVTSTVVQTLNGATIEVGLMGLEGMVGLSLVFGVENSNTTVLAQIPGAATRMRASDFIEQVLKRGGPLYKLLLRYSNAFMSMIAQVAACNNIHPLEERMCRWILMTHDRVNRDEFPLTHEFLSLMLGVRRPSISVVASTLQNAGMIRYTRGSITVADRRALENGTCECYPIIVEITKGIFKTESPYGPTASV